MGQMYNRLRTFHAKKYGKRPYDEKIWNELILVPKLQKLKDKYLANKSLEAEKNLKVEKWDWTLFRLTQIDKLSNTHPHVLATKKLIQQYIRERTEVQKCLDTFWT